MIGKIVKKSLIKISHIRILDAILLRMNDAYNSFLKTLLKHSFCTRMYLYGEGGLRLSNDPDIHMFYRWPVEGHIGWAQQPVFNIWALSLFEKKVVLELGCANGWYYREFYSNIKELSYYGVDINEDTIAEADRKCKVKNGAHFLSADILTDMPCLNATNVFWFSTMCMFTRSQQKEILNQIAQRLEKTNGILSGNCEIKIENEKQWDYYIGLLEGEDDLRRELTAYFTNVYIVRLNGGRTLYYMASNGKLPFYNG